VNKKKELKFIIFLLFLASLLGGILGGIIVNNLRFSSVLDGITIFSSPAFGALTSQEQAIMNAVKKVRPSVVNIDTFVTLDDYYYSVTEGIGSGIIVRRDGYILTNRHVIRDATKIKVTLVSGKTYEGKFICTHPQYDLALIKIDANNLQVAPFGDSSNLALGQVAIAIGNPLHFRWTVTVGVISALEREIEAGVDLPLYKGLIQTDAAINPGNSGGPLINTDGMVIGINTLIFSGTENTIAQGLGFAIPINLVKTALKEMTGKKTTESHRPWLGVKLQNVTPQLAQQWALPTQKGVLIVNVIANSPASKAKLFPGDIIVEADKKPVRSYQELLQVLSTKSAGSVLKLKVWHRGKKITKEVVLEASQ